jgi:hypothetical protein
MKIIAPDIAGYKKPQDRNKIMRPTSNTVFMD